MAGLTQPVLQLLGLGEIAPLGRSLIIAYLAICALLWAVQPRLIFFPQADLTLTPLDLELAYEEVRIPVGDGHIYGWWLPNDAPQDLSLLYFHGNGGNISTNLQKAAAFQAQGFSVLLIDYRGYGHSSGPFPSEARLYADARAAWDYLTQTRSLPPQSILLFGHSIGAAVAIDLALAQPEAAALIAEGAFANLKTLARSAGYGWVPLDLLLTQRFENDRKVPHLQVPVLYIHGLDDDIVPPTSAAALYELTPTPKQLWLLEEAGHNNFLEAAGADRYGQKVWHYLGEITDLSNPDPNNFD